MRTPDIRVCMFENNCLTLYINRQTIKYFIHYEKAIFTYCTLGSV